MAGLDWHGRGLPPDATGKPANGSDRNEKRDVKLFRIQAPRVAHEQQVGQFLILGVHERRERITIADSNSERGDVTIVVQGIGTTTKLLNSPEPATRSATLSDSTT